MDARLTKGLDEWGSKLEKHEQRSTSNIETSMLEEELIFERYSGHKGIAE